MGIEVYMTKIIYFADDEKNIRDLVVPFLEHDGFTVRAFETGDLLLEAYKNQKPDLVILDIMMPGTNGLDVMKSIRQYDNIPIIMLTARDSDVDFITAFNLGTDDYFTKPFSPIKLSLHVKALFKRLDEKAIKNDTQYQFLDLTLDTEKRIALLSNEEMPLTKTEFDFLLVLIEKPETAFSRETLLNRICGFDDIESRAVDDTIKRLRKKFKQYHSQVSIKTVWGYGFKLIKEDK